MGPALDRHIALIGFMGAGKTTLGLRLADRIGRRFVDLDRELERSLGRSIPELFAARGEAEFRVLEATLTLETLRNERPAVLALGGGAVGTDAIRRALREHALTVRLDVEPDVAWERVAGYGRPLARDPERFRALYEQRRPLYEAAADAAVRTVDDAVLAAAAVHVQVGGLELLGSLLPGESAIALVADATVAGIHGAAAQVALGARLTSVHELPSGEEAKSVTVAERLWRELRIGRDGTLVALGGGALTDAAGFVAASYLRGVAWAAVPTTIVGQVDAAIGGKTAIDLPEGKNLVGAFHWPLRTVVDAALLETLPAAERANGLAEVVKTGLLAGEPLWQLAEHEQVRRAAAFKAAVCLRDPTERGPRAVLNLGHTFGQALEAASDYRLAHGRAVALGLTAALRLSERHLGLDPAVRAEVARLLRPTRVAVDAARAWQALLRDKKGVAGSPRLVLLERPGEPRTGVELPEDELRAELDALVSQ